MPQEIKKRYIIRFKPKDKRINKHDDKILLLKRAVAYNTEKVTREEEMVLDIHDVGTEKNVFPLFPDKIVDMNEYDQPLIITSLSPDQFEEIKKNKNVEHAYEDFPSGIKPILSETEEILPLAVRDDAENREIVTDNVKQMKADRAWTYVTGRGVRCAIVDTGIYRNHSDISANFWGGQTFHGSQNPGDRNDGTGGFHGTGCASIVGSVKGNGRGVVGIAPEVAIYDVRVFGGDGSGASVGELVAAYNWVGVNGMHVANMSFGANYNISYRDESSWPQFMKDMSAALKASKDKQTAHIAGVGNDQGDADTFYPAAFPDVAGVSAIDWTGRFRDDFSNSGSSVLFCAPGWFREQGGYGLVAYAGHCPFDNKTYKGTNEYGIFNGTSMASPHVAGVFCLAWAANKALPCKKLYEGWPEKIDKRGVISRFIAVSADGLGSGWPKAAGRDHERGMGLPNAERAVKGLFDVNGAADQEALPQSIDLQVTEAENYKKSFF